MVETQLCKLLDNQTRSLGGLTLQFISRMMFANYTCDTDVINSAQFHGLFSVVIFYEVGDMCRYLLKNTPRDFVVFSTRLFLRTHTACCKYEAAMHHLPLNQYNR